MTHTNPSAVDTLKEWEERSEVDPALATQPLPDPDVVRLVVALRHTPSIAVPHQVLSWSQRDRVVTGAEVAQVVAHVGDALGQAFRDKEAVEEELRALKRDLAAFRRVLGLANLPD